MSIDSNQPIPGGWTTDTLAHYFSMTLNDFKVRLDHELIQLQALAQQRFSSLENGIPIALAAAEKSIKLASEKTKADTESLQALMMRSIDATAEKAEVANDTLQRLVEANMGAALRLGDVRFETNQLAVEKVEKEITKAHDAAAAAATSVDKASQMRHDAAAALTRSVEDKVLSRVSALQDLVDLRARMNETAIAKANEATDLRFQSVNEFRQTLSDQARDFVSTSALTANFNQTNQQIVSSEQQLRTYIDATTTRLASMDSQISSLNGKVIVGGSSIAIVLLVAQLMLNYVTTRPQASPVPTVTTTAVADNAKRVDDLITRLDALQRSGQTTPAK